MVVTNSAPDEFFVFGKLKESRSRLKEREFSSLSDVLVAVAVVVSLNFRRLLRFVFTPANDSK